MTYGRIGIVLAALLAALLAAPALGQGKVSEPPIPEPYKDKVVVPRADVAVEPEDAGFLYGAQAQGAHDVPLDTSALEARPVPEAALQRFRDDPAFQYDEEGPQARGPSLWQRFWDWLDRVLFTPMAEAASPLAWRIFWIVVALLVLGFFLSKLFGADVGGLFRRRDDPARGPEAGPLLDVEDIEAVDLDRLLADALAADHYREAVRYRYLRVLQRLAASGVVEWQKNKTNRDYLAEVRRAGQAGLAEPFAEVTRLFAWVWYGEAPVDADRFARIRPRFDQVEAALDGAPAVEARI